jgi:UDP-N-acetylmuramoyl-tripeptide--D-alanyl-D-alanine ligase
MKNWDPARMAAAAGAELLGNDPRPGPQDGGPTRVTIDSREARPGDLFVGLAGERVDGGVYGAQALAAGAWGVLLTPAHAQAAAHAGGAGVVLAHPRPLEGLQALARAWRRELGAKVVAITGSTGKTSTKDILAALLAGALRTVASPMNLNTDIGLPLAVLGAPRDTQALVLEMGMRGAGQIALLTAIAEPDVGVIVSVGPVHLQLLGSLEAIAAAKAELIAGLAPGATAVLPADAPLLDPHRPGDVRIVTFGEGGDVRLLEALDDGEVVIADGEQAIHLTPNFAQRHNLRNLLAAVAAARALGITPGGELKVEFSGGRGELLALPGELVLINDCYNANPMSMHAALDELQRSAPGRRVAILGDMLELGPGELGFHREIGGHATVRGVDLLVTVGPLAAAMQETFAGSGRALADVQEAVAEVPGLLRRGDTVLVKASNGVGLARLVERLRQGVASQPTTATPPTAGS